MDYNLHGVREVIAEVHQSIRTDIVTQKINIGSDFSTHLGPRKRNHGSFSGEQFLEELLLPAFERDDETLTIYLDQIQKPSASFFEEVFGGLVRRYGLDRVCARVSIVASKNAHLAVQIEQYMEEAEY